MNYRKDPREYFKRSMSPIWKYIIMTSAFQNMKHIIFRRSWGLRGDHRYPWSRGGSQRWKKSAKVTTMTFMSEPFWIPTPCIVYLFVVFKRSVRKPNLRSILDWFSSIWFSFSIDFGCQNANRIDGQTLMFLIQPFHIVKRRKSCKSSQNLKWKSFSIFLGSRQTSARNESERARKRIVQNYCG